MESHNAGLPHPADTLVARATRLSHFARRLVEAAPRSELDAAFGRAFSADEMRAALAADPGADEDGLKRALRVLRARVMLRLIARDLGGLASLDEVLATSTALAEIAASHALERLAERFADRKSVV